MKIIIITIETKVSCLFCLVLHVLYYLDFCIFCCHLSFLGVSTFYVLICAFILILLLVLLMSTYVANKDVY